MKKIIVRFFLDLCTAFFLLFSFQIFAQDDSQEPLTEQIDKPLKEEEDVKKKKSAALWHELDLDAYYTSFGIYLGIWGESPENLGEKKEADVYWHLIKTSYYPSFVVLEASVYPMPLAGVGLRKYAANFYEKGRMTNEFHAIQAVTSGYQEPYALSLFIGNIVIFKREGEEKKIGNQGFMGWVFSASNYHIKDNLLINDNWLEIEGKIKGDRIFPESKLSWSFKIGGRIHQHPDIEDVAFIGIRRSRIDQKGPVWSLFYNSGIEYTFDFDFKNWLGIRHYVLIEKKWPVYKKIALSLGLGFIWEAKEKYEGNLEATNEDNWEVFIRPNIHF